jgi:putative transposase
MSSGVFNKYTGYHNRHSIRLHGYDYSQPGYYFITICIHDKTQRLFGTVAGGKMVLNDKGNIAHDQFECLPGRFPNIQIDTFQVMPNHIHAVIHARATLAVDLQKNRGSCIIETYNSTVDCLNTTGQNTVKTYGAEASPAPVEIVGKTGDTKNNTIGDIIGAYKSLVSNECLKIYKSKNERMGKLWQRNYYDIIIRDERSLFFIRRYIRNNPLNWETDSKNHVNREIREIGMTEIGEKNFPTLPA